MGLAEQLRQLVGGEDELLLRPLVGGVVDLGVKRVDDQRPVHLHRLLFIGAVEEHASAKPAHAGLAGLMHDRIGPERDNPLGRIGGLFLALPGKPRVEVPRRTSGRHQQQQRQQRLAERAFE